MPSLATTLAVAVTLLSAAASAQPQFSASLPATVSTFAPPVATTAPQAPFACDDPNVFSVGIDFYDSPGCNGLPNPTKLSKTTRDDPNPGSFQNLPSSNSLAKSAKLFCSTNGGQVRVGYAGFSLTDSSNTEVFSSGTTSCVNAKTDGSGIELTFDKLAFEVV